MHLFPNKIMLNTDAVYYVELLDIEHKLENLTCMQREKSHN